MTASSPSAIAVEVAQADARVVAQLCAIDPAFTGGVVVRAFAGPVRDRWLADLRTLLGPGSPWRPVPVHVDDDRLLGGIDLAATLQSGRPVAQRGLLAEADGGVLLLSMAERMAGSTAAHVAAALDSGVVDCARDGIAARVPAVFGVVALDESSADDEAMSAALRDRLAFQVDLRDLSHRDCAAWPAVLGRDEIAAARGRLPDVVVDDAVVEALCAAALALGVWSLRASVQAVRAARLLAALDGRLEATADDAAVAARLVLAPRATRLPPQPVSDREEEVGAEGEPERQADEPTAADADPMEAADRPDDNDNHSDDGDERNDDDANNDSDDRNDNHDSDDATRVAPLEDAVTAAAAAAIPAGLLARLIAGDAAAGSRGAAGRVGALQASRRRGRPAGTRRDRPRAGARLDLMATMRAAVPWQRLRGRDDPAARPAAIRIRAEDFHVGRFKQRGRTTTIFAVDASGSSALHRLAEAKGAVELLLADCYVRRDSVAVVGFRGSSAELLLPPTRSLVRAKRSLAELPGGGGTPLAAGFDAAAALADAVRRRGDTAVIVILSDGRANVARDGAPGRPRAEAEARLAAGALRACAAAIVFVDTSTKPHPLARELAGLMGGRYLFLPHAEAATLSAAVRQAAPARSAAR